MLFRNTVVLMVVAAGSIQAAPQMMRREKANETAIETCTRLAAEASSGESMTGMDCYQVRVCKRLVPGEPSNWTNDSGASVY